MAQAAQLRVLYAKQLTQSDAACSKQIKLPKNEAKQFVGELKHRQSATLVVKDVRGNSWSFLCTCYGCQYALSRVGNFAKEFNLKAGDVLVFLEDEHQQLVVAVNEHAPLHLKPPTKAARGSQRRKPARTSPVRPFSTDSQPLSVTSSVEAPLGQHFSLLMHERSGSPSNVTSHSLDPGYAMEPCFAYKPLPTKRLHGHLVSSLHGSDDDEDEDAHGDDSDRVECSTKRPCRSHDVHVKAEPAAAWAASERRLPKQEPCLQDAVMEELDDRMPWQSSPPGQGGSSRPGGWQQEPPARPLPLLAKVLTKMDVACAHDKVGVVLPRDDVQVSVILGLLQHHEQQQRQQRVAYNLLQEPLQLQVVDLLRAEQRQLTSRDWMTCRLTPSPNRRFWYLTGLGSFLKRHAAQHGQVLELSCCKRSGTFWAAVR